jgi:hypothetical protein
MKLSLLPAMAFALSAGVATAQETTQTGVLGASGDPVYSLQVQGANGVIYNCMPEVQVVDGVRARRCVASGEGTLRDAGQGLTEAGPAIGALLVVLVAIGSGGGGSSTTSSTAAD